MPKQDMNIKRLLWILFTAFFSLWLTPSPLKENVYELLEKDILQAESPSCHPTNSVKALKG